MVPEGFIGIFENKGVGVIAVPHKCEVVQFRAVITAISCTTTVSEHENQKQKFTSYPRKRVSLKSLKVKKTVSRDYRIHPCILPFGPARGCSLKLMDSVLNITFSVMARRASHRDVTSKSAPAD